MSADEKQVKKEAPVVRVRSRGQISGALEGHAEKYRDRYPERDVRYVYDPTHKPELSGIVGRQAMGYELVTWGEIGVTGAKEEEVVRVGDLVLMSIDKETKQAIRDERAHLSRERMESVSRSFYTKIEEAASEKTPRHHSGPGVRPLGQATIEERVHEYEIEQREE